MPYIKSRVTLKTQRDLKRARVAEITAVCVKLASKPGGWVKLTRASIAHEACYSPGLVSHYLGSMPAIFRLLVKTAIKTENFSILVQAIAAGHPETLKMCPKLRAKALTSGV